MKNLLFFFILFSLCLPKQASASACLYPHLAYPKQQVSKKIIKKQLRQTLKSYRNERGFLGAVLLSLFLLGVFIGILGWLIAGIASGTFVGIVWWIIGGGLTSILVFFFLVTIKAI